MSKTQLARQKRATAGELDTVEIIAGLLPGLEALNSLEKTPDVSMISGYGTVDAAGIERSSQFTIVLSQSIL